MSLKARWAYRFTCDVTKKEILAVFNEARLWTWCGRSSDEYGDYLDT
jgi:hypothetical protein